MSGVYISFSEKNIEKTVWNLVVHLHLGEVVSRKICRTVGAFCVVVAYHGIKITGDVLEDGSAEVERSQRSQ